MCFQSNNDNRTLRIMVAFRIKLTRRVDNFPCSFLNSGGKILGESQGCPGRSKAHPATRVNLCTAHNTRFRTSGTTGNE